MTVLANRKASRANAKIVVTDAAKVGVAGKKKKSVSDGINQLVRVFDTATFLGEVIPDAVQIGSRLRCYAVGHQRGADSSAARRVRPRCFTSSASSRMDACVIWRPSPRAREALASWRVARNSARLRSLSSHRERAS